MQYINDFENTHLVELKEPVIDEKSGVPKFLICGVKARRCMKCDKICFANYKFLDYECMDCR